MLPNCLASSLFVFPCPFQLSNYVCILQSSSSSWYAPKMWIVIFFHCHYHHGNGHFLMSATIFICGLISLIITICMCHANKQRLSSHTITRASDEVCDLVLIMPCDKTIQIFISLSSAYFLFIKFASCHHVLKFLSPHNMSLNILKSQYSNQFMVSICILNDGLISVSPCNILQDIFIKLFICS